MTALLVIAAVSFLATAWILAVLRASRMVPPTRPFPPAESATGDERWAGNGPHSSAGGSLSKHDKL